MCPFWRVWARPSMHRFCRVICLGGFLLVYIFHCFLLVFFFFSFIIFFFFFLLLSIILPPSSFSSFFLLLPSSFFIILLFRFVIFLPFFLPFSPCPDLCFYSSYLSLCLFLLCLPSSLIIQLIMIHGCWYCCCCCCCCCCYYSSSSCFCFGFSSSYFYSSSSSSYFLLSLEQHARVGEKPAAPPGKTQCKNCLL